MESSPALAPALFIFHCGRCGSTLLGRLLEADPTSRVFLEPNAILRFFELNAERLDRPEMLSNFRALVRSYGLTPDESERRTVFKLMSNSVRWTEWISRAFPEATLVYLLRNPAEVIASNLLRLPAFLGTVDRADLARTFGGIAARFGESSLAEWCAWYVNRNLELAWEQRSLFRYVIDYRDYRSAFLHLARELSVEAVDWEATLIESILSADTKRPGRPFSSEADARKVSSEVRQLGESVAGESYARWQRHLVPPAPKTLEDAVGDPDSKGPARL